MYYLIDGNPDQRYDDIEDVLDYCVNSEYYEDDTDSFEEYLNCDGSIEVCGYSFLPSEILYECNHDAYQRELTTWAEEQVEYGRENERYELEHADSGDRVWVCNYEVYVMDDGGDTDGDESLEDIVAALEEKLSQKKLDEEEEIKTEKKTENDFLTTLGIQII